MTFLKINRSLLSKRIILLIMGITIRIISHAQSFEIGVRAGGDNYLGDAAPNFPALAETQLSTGAFANYYFSRRLGIGLQYNKYILTGRDANLNQAWAINRNLQFSSQITEGGVRIIYAMQDFDACTDNFLPYLTIGASLFQYASVSFPQYIADAANTGTTAGDSISIPVGLGIKYIFRNNVALGLEAIAARSFTDELDYPLWIGNQFATDYYLFGGATLSYFIKSCGNNDKGGKEFKNCFKFK